MRVIVTRIGPDRTIRRRIVDTAASSDASAWEELAARALASPRAYRPVPGDPVYHLRVDEYVVLVAEHGLSGLSAAGLLLPLCSARHGAR